MARRDETYGTVEIERDLRYHQAASTSHPETEHLVPVIQGCETRLRGKRQAREDKELARMVARAQLVRVDFDVNELIREVELGVQAEVKKNREDPRYKACFPKGLSLIALKGKEEADELALLAKGLKQHFPSLWAEHGAKIEELAKKTVAAEEAAMAADREVEVAWMEERLARKEAVTQLRRNEGALIAQFPGDRAKVRSFFRQLPRKDDAQPDEQ